MGKEVGVSARDLMFMLKPNVGKFRLQAGCLGLVLQRQFRSPSYA